LTAYAGEVDQQQAIAAGFQSHLSKPVDPDAIIAVIVRLCERQGSVGVTTCNTKWSNLQSGYFSTRIKCN